MDQSTTFQVIFDLDRSILSSWDSDNFILFYMLVIVNSIYLILKNIMFDGENSLTCAVMFTPTFG